MNRRSLLTLLLIGLLLASCGAQPAAAEPTQDVNTAIAAGAQTMVASIFQTQTAAAPPATNTALPTATSLPTTTPLALPTTGALPTQAIFYAATATPTGTFYTATPLNSSLAVGCNNLKIINSYTSPDSPLNAGQSFTQSWQVENTGSCNWMFVYGWTYISGEKFGEATSVRLGKQIPPGKWTTLSLNLTAPNKSGTFKATWKMTDGNKPFGEPLPISITVGGPTKTPAATETVDAVQTAVAGTVIVQMTQSAAVQQTAISIGQTAVAATATCQALVNSGAQGVPPCP